ncbi:hypothetical protein ACIHIX_18240 [Streptomyces sp. NPDC051913]|uniref:hypothetical protein n=1 Tax=Streptomyces sp. NPDC051913 TaxID=3365676 RepID=UPI0037D1445F
MADFHTGVPAPTRWCSYHAAPFRPKRRLQEAHNVHSLFQEPDAVGGVPANWKSISGDRHPDGSYCGPGPYLDRDHRKLRHQGIFDPNDADVPTLTDWQAGEFLRCGHWGDAKGKPDDFGRRRIDTLRVTENVAATTRAHTTHYGPGAEALHGLEVAAA